MLTFCLFFVGLHFAVMLASRIFNTVHQVLYNRVQFREKLDKELTFKDGVGIAVSVFFSP
jgi:hypothetical protein